MTTITAEENQQQQQQQQQREKQQQAVDNDDDNDVVDNLLLEYAIIGAGAAGLNVAKTLLETFPHYLTTNIAIFEEKSDVGGLWNQRYNDDDDDNNNKEEEEDYQRKQVVNDDNNEIQNNNNNYNRCFIIDDDIDDNSNSKRKSKIIPILTSTNRIYKDLIANTPKDIMDFIDYRYPLDTPLMPRPYHILKYLKSYATNFNLYSYIKFNTKVIKCEKLYNKEGKDHQYWAITVSTNNTCTCTCTCTSDRIGDNNDSTITTTTKTTKSSSLIATTTTKTTKTFYSKRLIVCVGHHSKPYVPEQIQGLRHFKGTLMHSSAFQSVDQFNDDIKTILIVGGGISGIDIAKIISQSGSIQVILSIREWKPWPHDIILTKIIKKSNGRIQIRPGISHISNEGQVYFMKQQQQKQKQKQKQDDVVIIFNNDEPIQQPDVIIFATGYRYEYPFLSTTRNNGGLVRGGENTCDDDKKTKNFNKDFYNVMDNNGCKMNNLYMRMIYIDDPSLVFMGIPAMVVSPFMLVEYQSKFYVKYVQGRLLLKNVTKSIMYEEIESRKNDNNNDNLTARKDKTPIPGFLKYCNDLSRLTGDYSIWNQFFWIRVPRIFHSLLYHFLVTRLFGGLLSSLKSWLWFQNSSNSSRRRRPDPNNNKIKQS